MTTWNPRANHLFLQALELRSLGERQEYLDGACAGDAALRAEVESLLEASTRAGSFLESPAPAADLVPAVDTLSVAERPGSVIGPYTLRELIGEGGMGLVYVAEQQQPVRRKVALKIIKPGMDSRQVIARFEAERQALALMDHPNIARVLDAGTTDSGRPYFVMELVKGVSLTEYCDQNRLTTSQRLELFIPICRALQHAHHKGVIHRDLKPANILVTVHDVTPVVKVIDFGIAKAIGQQLTEKTVYTSMAQLVGTPQYMSPEQAGLSGLDVDTRSDIYALGVLLYELLTGTTPFESVTLRKAGYDEMRRIIREEEPPKPSTRLSTLQKAALSTTSERRSVDPRKLRHEVRGEMDWIVMKALEKDRNRRYESANAFAQDIQRYLQDLPVEACPPSAAYRLRKFVRRHKTRLVSVVLPVLLLVLVGGGFFWWQAGQHAATAQAVAKDLEEADLWQREQQWAKAFQALERAKGRLGESGSEALQARVEQRRREVNLVDRLEKARLQALAVAGVWDRDYAGTDRAYRSAFAENGMDVVALAPEEIARLIRISAIRAQLVTALDYWAFFKERLPGGNGEPLSKIARLADSDPWRQMLREAHVAKDRSRLETIAAEEGVLAQPPANLLILSYLLDRAEGRAASVALLRRVQQRYPADFWANYELAMHLDEDWATVPEAVAFLRAAVALQPESPAVYNRLGISLWHQPMLPEAVAAFRRAIELKPDFAEAYWFMGRALQERNDFALALGALKRAHELGSQRLDWLRYSAAMVRNAEQLVLLGPHLPKLLSGDKQPVNAVELLALSSVSGERGRQLYAASARFFAGAVAAEPKLANNLDTHYYRYNAACSAALAGCGQGKDAAHLDAKEHARLRAQSLAWLRAGLADWRSELDMNPTKTRPLVRQTMQHWQRDRDFTGVRGEAALAKLPEAERQEWQKLWQEVEALGRQAAQTEKQVGPTKR